MDEDLTTRPALSIIIVSWNVRDHVLACLASIAADEGKPSAEVILVDNSSADGTTEAVRRSYPWVHVLANSENIGFPRANNQALRHARASFVLYLNPDTEVAPGTLARCLRELESEPGLGAVGCRIEYPDGRIQYEGARSAYRFRHLLYEVLYLHMLFPHNRIFGEHLLGDWDHRGTRDVEALSGAFMMVPRDLALELGGLPDEVFMYHEDLSFCLAVRRAGRRIRYVGDASIVHHCGQSSLKSSSRLALLEVEVKQRFIREADGPAWAAAARAVLGLRALLRLGICAVGALLPSSWKEAYPRVFDTRTHWLQIRWCIRPRSVSAHMPRVPETAAEPIRMGARQA